MHTMFSKTIRTVGTSCGDGLGVCVKDAVHRALLAVAAVSVAVQFARARLLVQFLCIDYLD